MNPQTDQENRYNQLHISMESEIQALSELLENLKEQGLLFLMCDLRKCSHLKLREKALLARLDHLKQDRIEGYETIKKASGPFQEAIQEVRFTGEKSLYRTFFLYDQIESLYKLVDEQILRNTWDVKKSKKSQNSSQKELFLTFGSKRRSPLSGAERKKPKEESDVETLSA